MKKLDDDDVEAPKLLSGSRAKKSLPKDAAIPISKPDFSQWNAGWTPEYLKLQQDSDSVLSVVKARLREKKSSP